MARIRTVKPDFFRDEDLQDLEAANPGAYVMLAFEGLWCQCDKAGRFEWKPRSLKLDILPFLNYDLAQTLEILAANGFVVRYTVNGKDYGLIPTFLEHQRISGKESQEPAKYPDPERTGERCEKQSGSNREASGIAGREGKGREYVELGKPNIPDSKIPKSLKPQSVEVLTFLNEKASRAFRPTDANLELIAARLKEGATVDDLKGVVENRVAAWMADDKMREYLRPATLFNRTKFSQYSGELGGSRRDEIL